jgi:hypothetical protein
VEGFNTIAARRNRTHQLGNCGDQMDEQDGQITHYAIIVSISAGITRLGFFTGLWDKIGIRHTQGAYDQSKTDNLELVKLPALKMIGQSED